jgi:hypothetical protein
MKIYFVEFTHKQSGKKFYKFGITKYGDVMKRFSKEESIRFKNDPDQYDDFNIRVIASAWNEYDQVSEQEKILLNKYPKNIWVEEYVGVTDKTYKFSGVTECVSLTYDQVVEARKYMYNLREEWGNDKH